MKEFPKKLSLPLARDKIFLGKGEMGRLISEYPWERTPLGPISSWSISLITSLSLMLNSQHPMCIGWGKDLIFFLQ